MTTRLRVRQLSTFAIAIAMAMTMTACAGGMSGGDAEEAYAELKPDVDRLDTTLRADVAKLHRYQQPVPPCGTGVVAPDCQARLDAWLMAARRSDARFMRMTQSNYFETFPRLVGLQVKRVTPSSSGSSGPRERNLFGAHGVFGPNLPPYVAPEMGRSVDAGRQLGWGLGQVASRIDADYAVHTRPMIKLVWSFPAADDVIEVGATFLTEGETNAHFRTYLKARAAHPGGG